MHGRSSARGCGRRWCQGFAALAMAACGSADGDAVGTTGTTASSSGGSTTTATGATGSSGGPETTGTSTEGSSSTAATSGSDDGTTGADTTAATGGETGLGDCSPLLVEAFYDADAPSDDELQWLKLYNPCDVEVDLSTWSIGYGRGDLGDVEGYTAGAKAFVAPAILAAGDCFVVGGPATVAENGDPDYDFPDDFAPGLFAPDAAAAGIALFDLAPFDLASVPVDAVVYGPNNDNGLIDGSGLPVAVPHVGAAPAGSSIRRTGLDATWEIAATPTPNVCPRF